MFYIRSLTLCGVLHSFCLYLGQAPTMPFFSHENPIKFADIMYFQMEAQPDRLHSQNENRGEVDVSQRELLMEAFGSMNLGARTEDAARYGPLTTTQFNYVGFLLGPYS